MSNSNYLREFKALVTTVQQLGGELGVEASRVREQLDNDETVMDFNNPSEAEQTRSQCSPGGIPGCGFSGKKRHEALW